MSGGGRRNGRRTASTLVSLMVLAIGLLGSAEATAVTLQWDSNRESDVTGYLVKYGTQSGELTTTVDVGNHTSYQFTNLDAGHTYYFVVHAYNRSGLVSPPSAEVSATIGIGSLSLTNLMANLTPPRSVGTSVIFTAASSGGVAPYQYKWFIADGTRLTIARDWSADNTFTWRPQIANPNYAIKARVRSATNTSDAPENSTSERSLAFPITLSDVTVINLVADREAPQPPATRILFTATASGGAAAYEYQWSLFTGTNWMVVQNWSSNGRFAWTPTSANPRYQVMVRVRGGQNLAANAAVVMPFPIQ